METVEQWLDKRIAVLFEAADERKKRIALCFLEGLIASQEGGAYEQGQYSAMAAKMPDPGDDD